MAENKKDERFLSGVEEAQAWGWRIVWIIAILAVVCGGGVSYVTKRAKVVRAAKLLQEARQMAARQDWVVANDKISAAMEIGPGNIDLYRLGGTVALHLPKGDPMVFWEHVIRHPSATIKDWEDCLEMTIATRRFDAGGPLLKKLTEKASPGNRTLYLAAKYWQARRDIPQAVKNAKACVERDPNYTDAVLLLGELMAGSGSEPDRLNAKRMLIDVARKDASRRIEAVVSLAALPLTKEEAVEISSFTQKEPPTKVVGFLAAQTIAIIARPENKDALVNEAILRYANGIPDELISLVLWLNAQGRHTQTIENFLERAKVDLKITKALVEAFTVTKRWKELGEFVSSGELGLDPVYVECVRAQAAGNLGEAWEATTHWSQARVVAANDPAKLSDVARMAEESGALEEAFGAFRKLMSFPAYADEAATGALRQLRRLGRTTDLRLFLYDIQQLQGDETHLQGYAVYLSLLQKRDVAKLKDEAEKQHEKNPSDPDWRSAAALALVLEKQFEKASRLYDAQRDEFPPHTHHRVVYAAVLRGIGKTQEALGILAPVNPRDLLPEEAPLIAGLQPPKAAAAN